MQTETTKAENHALLANDIRVLVAQLNDVIRKASDTGLRIEICNREILDVVSVSRRPELTVQIFAQVQ